MKINICKPKEKTFKQITLIVSIQRKWIEIYDNQFSFDLAIRIDDVDVRGYTAWSLMDNFEWNRATTERFGLYYVNFTDPERPRIPKASSRFFRQLIETNGFLPNFEIPRAPFEAVSDHRDPNNLPMSDIFYYGTFPDDFAWSSATASYQVEGAWNEDGRYIIMG